MSKPQTMSDMFKQIYGDKVKNLVPNSCRFLGTFVVLSKNEILKYFSKHTIDDTVYNLNLFDKIAQMQFGGNEIDNADQICEIMKQKFIDDELNDYLGKMLEEE